MTRAFIVHLIVPDDGSVTLNELAGDLQEDLNSAGYDVEKVEVWSSPNDMKAMANTFMPPQQASPQPPTLL